jgi:hypothetical protein
VRLHWTARAGWAETCRVYRYEVLVSLFRNGVRGWTVDGVLALDGFPPESLPVAGMQAGVRGRRLHTPFLALCDLLTARLRHDLDCDITVEPHHLEAAYEAMED